MSSKDKNLSQYNKEKTPSGKGLTFAIVVSEWNEAITFSMLDACKKTLAKHKVKEEDIQVFQVPGTYELPYGAKLALSQKKPDALIALGCVVRGETKHDDYINNAVSSGLMQLSIIADVPCIFGVLTTNDMQQAIERSGGKHGNKGTEAAITAIRMADLKKTKLNTNKTIGF